MCSCRSCLTDDLDRRIALVIAIDAATLVSGGVTADGAIDYLRLAFVIAADAAAVIVC